MSFYGSWCEFDGKPCQDFGLELCHFGSPPDEGGEIGVSGEIIETYIGGNPKPLFYGKKYTQRRKLSLTLMLNNDRTGKGHHLSRIELSRISAWLTEHDTYKRLIIGQGDMDAYHFKCMFTSVKTVEYGGVPWGVECTAECDSLYAYLPPKQFTFGVNDTLDTVITNDSTASVGYKPIVEITLTPSTDGLGRDFSITNLVNSGSGRGTSIVFKDIPATVTSITVDCERQIVTCPQGINMYPYFNFGFLELHKGSNFLTMSGNGRVIISCEFCEDIGG